MSQLSGQADFVYSVGADTRLLEKAVSDTTKKAESALGNVGTAIEKKTEGLRRFTGALGSTIGIATGLIGVAGAVAGAAYGIYKVYDEIANAADRVAEANEKSNQQTREAIQLAQQKLSAEKNFLAVLKAQNVASVDRRLAELRAENEKLTEVTTGRMFGLGIRSIVKSAQQFANWNSRVNPLVAPFSHSEPFPGANSTPDDPNMLRFESNQQQIADLETKRGEILRGTTAKASAEITSELQEQERSLMRQIEIQAARARGDEATATAIERRAAHLAEIHALEERYIELRDTGLSEQAAQMERQIRLKNQLYAAENASLDLARRKVDAEKMAADQMKADSIERMLQERLYRQQGREDLANQLRMEEERAGLIERINSLQGVSGDRRNSLLEQVEQLMALQGFDEDGSRAGVRGPRFGSGVEGDIGSVAAAQVLGGGFDPDQAMNRERNNFLKSINEHVQELVRASRDGGVGGTAVFG